MTIEEAKDELKAAKMRLKETRERVAQLRKIITSLKPKSKVDKKKIAERNVQFYLRMKDGESHIDIGDEHNISPYMVLNAYRRISLVLREQWVRSNDYETELLRSKGLLPPLKEQIST